MNLWSGIGIVILYLMYQPNILEIIKNKEPNIEEFDKGIPLGVRESVLKIELFSSARAYSLAISFSLFGMLIAIFTEDLILATIVSTVGLFGAWNSWKSVRFFSRIA